MGCAMRESGYEIGMVGLGVMGRNLLLNMADHRFSVAGYDTDPTKVETLRAEAQGRRVFASGQRREFLESLRSPRATMMLVPAGPPVDAVIRDLLPDLSPGDVLIDGGNSHFADTDLRQKTLADRGIGYLGIGVSGGEHGARHGPSLMPGGPTAAYERVRPILEATAAKVGDEPCVAYLGSGSAGHYVKTVHNGIEYGLMQLIAEAYGLMSRGLGLTDDDLQRVFERWNQSELNAYLVEITAQIFGQVDAQTGKRLVDVILDEAKQKGTGMWTSQDAMSLQVPVPTIDTAVAMRDLSGYKNEREDASRLLRREAAGRIGDRDEFLARLRDAVYVGMVVTFAQGMALLRKASQTYGYGLDLGTVARIWRGGCIIRAVFLEDVRTAFDARPDLPNLLQHPPIAQAVLARQESLRAIIHSALDLGIPTPGLMSAIAYFDAHRSAWLPANLTQAQRDFFGAHTYERIDAKGVFHTQWGSDSD